MYPAANEESASLAYAPRSGDLPSHHAQTGEGQRYLFVPATLAGKAHLGRRRHERHHRKERTAAPGEDGTNMTHWGKSATSRASARTSNLLRTRPTTDQPICGSRS